MFVGSEVILDARYLPLVGGSLCTTDCGILKKLNPPYSLLCLLRSGVLPLMELTNWYCKNM